MNTFLFLATTLSLAQAQIVPLAGPRPLWATRIPASSEGNACKMYGMDSLLVCTGFDGSTSALKPDADDTVGGTLVWTHLPSPVTGTQTYSTSGVVFGINPTIGNYIIHAVSEGFPKLDPSYCVVYALNPLDGSVIWRSQDLEGACSGTPVLSKDGNYVFLTHNLVSVGHFTVLAANLNGLGFYSQLDPVQPYGPPGIFHMPLEGYYPGGSGNRNDIVMWAYQPMPNEDTVGVGKMFVFQFPIGFQGESVGLGVLPLGNVTWQTKSAPQIYNNGYSMAFGVSRAQFRSWNGGFGDQQNRFDKGATNKADTFIRGDPKSQAPFSSLALSSDPLAPMMFGGTGGIQFVGFDSELNLKWLVNTTYPIYAKAQVAPDDATVYCVAQNGDVRAIETANGNVLWIGTLSAGVPMLSDFAQSKNGKYLYFNNQGGFLNAWQVADAPSPAPSTTPSNSPSAPTPEPSRGPDSPTVFPTLRPSSSPSLRPSSGPSGVPSLSPSDETPSSSPSTKTPLPTPAPFTRPTPTRSPGTNRPTPSSGVTYRLAWSIFMGTMAAAIMSL